MSNPSDEIRTQITAAIAQHESIWSQITATSEHLDELRALIQAEAPGDAQAQKASALAMQVLNAGAKISQLLGDAKTTTETLESLSAQLSEALKSEFAE